MQYYEIILQFHKRKTPGMDKKELHDLLNSIKKSLNTKKTALEKNMPGIEKNLKLYAQKIGIKPEDIDKAKDKVRDKLNEIQKNK